MLKTSVDKAGLSPLGVRVGCVPWAWALKLG